MLLHDALPQLLLVILGCFEVRVAVAAPREHVAVHTKDFAFKLFLSTAPSLHKVVLLRVHAPTSEAVRIVVVALPPCSPPKRRNSREFLVVFVFFECA